MVGDQVSAIFDDVVVHLGESRELSVYEAIERLVQSAQAVGLDGGDLVRLLDRGMSFEDLLELIESKLESLPKAA